MTKILDYGCGKGYFANHLSKRTNTIVYGIDISEESINFANVKFPNVTFIYTPGLPLPFEDNFFDEIYMMDVLEHVDDLDHTIGEVVRLLKQNGKLVAIVPGEKSEKWLLKIRPSYHEEIHHVRIFKDQDLEKKFEKEGVKLIFKRPKGFLENFALSYLFKTAPKSSTQLAIGNWNRNFVSKIVYAFFLMFNQKVLTTRLKYFPVWIITLPIGFIINLIGNKFFPKSYYYKLRKI